MRWYLIASVALTFCMLPLLTAQAVDRDGDPPAHQGTLNDQGDHAMKEATKGDAGATEHPQASDATKMKSEAGVTGAIRAEDFLGSDVRNSAGEDLGNVEDLMIDLNTGQIRYVALSFGGFLGIGDKLYAIPFKSLKFLPESGERDAHFVLNIDKERLNAAPSFTENNWPNFADPDVTGQIDRFYLESPRTAERPDSLERK